MGIAAGPSACWPQPAFLPCRGLPWQPSSRASVSKAGDTNQGAKQEARSTKVDCRQENNKSNSQCRQDKRDTKQDGRQEKREIKY